jgi:Spy/CpxP family protein refolding chaperone
MKFRATLLTLGLILGAVAAAHAQGQGQSQGQAPGQGDYQQRRMQMMFKDITLTQPEQTKVDSIMAVYRAKLPPRPAAGTQPDSASMAARRVIMDKQNADIRAALTKEQQPVFDKNIKDMQAMMQQHRPQ